MAGKGLRCTWPEHFSLLVLPIKVQASLTRLSEENNFPCISCIIQQVGGGIVG